MNDTEKKVRILADTRERGKIIEKLQALPGVTLEFAEQECGDYVLGNGVVVERKSATDFILSIVDKTLLADVGKLRAVHGRPVYVVEGDLFTMRFHQKAFDVHMALAHLAVVQGIPVIASPDVEQSAMLIYLMAVDAQHNLAARPNMRLAKPGVRSEAQQFLVEGLPGVDADRAERLLSRFGGAMRVFGASAEALAEVDGISSEMAARIRAVLDSNW